jgi:hypothetical protein
MAARLLKREQDAAHNEDRDDQRGADAARGCGVVINTSRRTNPDKLALRLIVLRILIMPHLLESVTLVGSDRFCSAPGGIRNPTR